MTNKILSLIKNKKFDDAIHDIRLGLGSPVLILNKLNLEYCLFKSKNKFINENKYNSNTKDVSLYSLVENIEHLNIIQEYFHSFNVSKIKIKDIKNIVSNSIKIIFVDENPSALDIYRECRGSLSPMDVIVQVCTSENDSSRVHTVTWLNKMGLSCILLNSTKLPPVAEFNALDFIDLKIKNSHENISFISNIQALSKDEFYKTSLNRINNLKVPFLNSNEITNKIRNNLGRDKAGIGCDAISLKESVYSFPKESCHLYLANKFYNLTGKKKPSKAEVNDYFENKLIHRNYYSEKIAFDLNLFEQSPFEFVTSGCTVILLDPTSYDQDSGISSYLINMYKFLCMSRLVENILFVKNKFPSTNLSNRDNFRDYVADKFNPLVGRSDRIIFIDSEAHYPGGRLQSSFKKICIVHCSSVLAAKFDGKLPAKMPESLIKIMGNELKNISSAYKIITPTVYHDNVQKSFFKDNLPNFVDYKCDNLINYIHDEYIKYIPIKAREYDLVFIGRPQRMKGFDILLGIAKNSENLKIAIITNGKNLETEELELLKNVKIFYNISKDVTYTLLSHSKTLIDLSPHHNCSTVFLEAINAKTPAIVRNLSTYKEILQDDKLRSLCLFLEDEDIKNPILLQEIIVNHLNKLNAISDYENEAIEYKYNKFMLTNYLDNYKYYDNLFKKLSIKKKKFATSQVYESLLKGRRVINVVHSNALSNSDGLFIDSHDLVVRFNRAIENIVPERHGNRTDILYSCLNRSPESGNMTKESYDKWISPENCWVVKAYPNMQWQGFYSFLEDHQAGATNDNYLFESFNKNPIKTSEFSLDWYKLIETNIKSRPNTGVLAVLDIIQYDIESLYLKGYTFFKGGYDSTYRSKNENEVMSYMANAGNHDQYKQNLFLRKIILTESKIIFDESLSEILNKM